MEFGAKFKAFDRSFFHLLLVALLGLAAYSNTFDVPFQFDDAPNISGNPLVKGLRYFIDVPKNKGWLSDSFKSRYIGFLSFALNYKAGGLDVMGYHVVNLAIHILNAMLIYFLVILTFRTPCFKKEIAAPRSSLIALFSALLFVSHPIQTQAVTYIVQRFASLATMFYLLSLAFYIKWRLSSLSTVGKGGRGGIFLYLLSFLSAVLAMKTKEMAATLPAVILLYELIFFKGPLKKRLFSLSPIFLTALIVPLTFISIGSPVGDLMGDVSEASRVQTAMPRLGYLYTQMRVVVTYIRLLFLPINQNLDYDYPMYGSLFEPEVFMSFALLASVLGLGACLLKRSALDGRLRLASFGIFFFFITLAPESGLIPIVDLIFEHRVYLPSVGVSIAFTSGAFVLAERFNERKTVIIILVLASIALAGAAYARNGVWRNRLSLWEDVVKKSPNKARGHYNLGVAYQSEGRMEPAVEEYLAAIKYEPDYFQAHNNLGNVYYFIGRPDMALEEYTAALRLRPDLADTRFNLGFLYLQTGRADKALPELMEALRLDPGHARARQYLGYIENRPSAR